MKKLLRALLVVVMVYAAVMAVMAVQYFFDRGDLKKASQFVYEYLPNTQSTLVGLMAAHYAVAEDAVYCETSLLSRYEGKVLLECGRKEVFRPGNSQENFEFVVNVVAHTVAARNPLAKNLLPTAL